MKIDTWPPGVEASPVIKAIQQVPDEKARTKILRYINWLAERGLGLIMPHRRPLGKNLHELRPDHKNIEYRIYFTVRNSTAWLLHFIRHTRGAEDDAIKLARKRAKDIL